MVFNVTINQNKYWPFCGLAEDSEYSKDIPWSIDKIGPMKRSFFLHSTMKNNMNCGLSKTDGLLGPRTERISFSRPFVLYGIYMRVRAHVLLSILCKRILREEEYFVLYIIEEETFRYFVRFLAYIILLWFYAYTHIIKNSTMRLRTYTRVMYKNKLHLREIAHNQ